MITGRFTFRLAGLLTAPHRAGPPVEASRLNPYSYVEQSPLQLWDPDGLEGEDEPTFRVIVVDYSHDIPDEVMRLIVDRMDKELDRVAGQSKNPQVSKGFRVESHEGPLTDAEIKKLGKYDFVVYMVDPERIDEAAKMAAKHFGSDANPKWEKEITAALKKNQGRTRAQPNVIAPRTPSFVPTDPYIERCCSENESIPRTMSQELATDNLADLASHELGHAISGKGNSIHQEPGLMHVPVKTPANGAPAYFGKHCVHKILLPALEYRVKH